MAGEFAQLLPFHWRGTHMPITRLHMSIAHDLVEHKYWGVNGARVEDTGIAPVRIEAVIPISNHIYPGVKEKWTAGALYPDGLRSFMISFGKRETGLLGHPEFGDISCKAERLEFELTGERQDGTEIRASWVETLDDEISSVIVASPVQDIELSASDLEASMADLRALVPKLPVFVDDLASIGRKLTALVDTVSILEYRTAGAVNKLLYQAHRMQVSIARAKSALTWPATNNLNRIIASAHTLRKQLLHPKGIGLYVVPHDMTLAGVSVSLPRGTAMGDVVRLNPNLVRSPVVLKGATVRYPLAA